MSPNKAKHTLQACRPTDLNNTPNWTVVLLKTINSVLYPHFLGKYNCYFTQDEIIISFNEVKCKV